MWEGLLLEVFADWEKAPDLYQVRSLSLLGIDCEWYSRLRGPALFAGRSGKGKATGTRLTDFGQKGVAFFLPSLFLGGRVLFSFLLRFWRRVLFCISLHNLEGQSWYMTMSALLKSLYEALEASTERSISVLSGATFRPLWCNLRKIPSFLVQICHTAHWNMDRDQANLQWSSTSRRQEGRLRTRLADETRRRGLFCSSIETVIRLVLFQLVLSWVCLLLQRNNKFQKKETAAWSPWQKLPNLRNGSAWTKNKVLLRRSTMWQYLQSVPCCLNGLPESNLLQLPILSSCFFAPETPS